MKPWTIFRWFTLDTLWWAATVTSAVATRSAVGSTAPSSPPLRTCLTRQRSTPWLSSMLPGLRWSMSTWRLMERWLLLSFQIKWFLIFYFSKICIGYIEISNKMESYDVVLIVFWNWRNLLFIPVSWTFFQVELIEVKKHLETRSKYVLNLQRKGLIKQVCVWWQGEQLLSKQRSILSFSVKIL